MSCTETLSSRLSVFFFKQRTAYEMRIRDWSSDVCSSDLIGLRLAGQLLRLTAHWSLSVRLGLRQQFADDYQRLIDAGFTFTGIMPAEGNPGWQALFHRGATVHPITFQSDPMHRLHEHVQAPPTT